MIIGAILVARLSSTRLPKKNILRVSGKPMIEQLADRVLKAKLVDKVIIATSNLPSDDPLEELAKKNGIGCYRGSLDNVMERISRASSSYGCDTIVEILGDNPLVHSDLIDNVIELYLNEKLDYAANITTEYKPYSIGKKLFPIGLRVQVYSKKVADQYFNYPDYPSNGRHPCAFIFDHPEKYKVGYLEAIEKWAFINYPDLNFAVNYPKNFELTKKIFACNYPSDNNFDLKLIFNQLDREPKLLELFGPEWN